MTIRFTSCLRSVGEVECNASLRPSSSKLKRIPGYRSSSPGYVGPKALLTPTLRSISSGEDRTIFLYRTIAGGCESRSLRMQIVWRRCSLPEKRRSKCGLTCRIMGVVVEASGSYLMSIWGYNGCRLRVSRSVHSDVPNECKLSSLQTVLKLHTDFKYPKANARLYIDLKCGEHERSERAPTEPRNGNRSENGSGHSNLPFDRQFAQRHTRFDVIINRTWQIQGRGL